MHIHAYALTYTGRHIPIPSYTYLGIESWRQLCSFSMLRHDAAVTECCWMLLVNLVSASGILLEYCFQLFSWMRRSCALALFHLPSCPQVLPLPLGWSGRGLVAKELEVSIRSFNWMFKLLEATTGYPPIGPWLDDAYRIYRFRCTNTSHKSLEISLFCHPLRHQHAFLAKRVSSSLSTLASRHGPKARQAMHWRRASAEQTMRRAALCWFPLQHWPWSLQLCRWYWRRGCKLVSSHAAEGVIYGNMRA